ncbi:helix-turn-helix domain-containing protein [Citrobacter amalonaticus]|uniref:helix-turn-helix domain-containing protein n=1 Tax=Citrobacter amalonaticus TaxID=35703 RepID=UPI0025A7107A|nr:helix-turn-helix domain-containing protein [Citrobacter amalonaticus]EKY5001819.1 helix-turn-helix domain-containing protein [Citrobacter amalonaticus]
MTDNATTALFDFIPFHPNNDNEHTFTPIPRAIARIKKFNGVTNDPGICLVYAHLLGWLNSTGDIRPSQQYIADDCVMSVDSVQRKIKALVKMGWITATPIRNPGCKQISHTVYTVKTPEEILKELPKTIRTKEEKPDEQQPRTSEPSACVADLPSLPDPIQAPNQPTGNLRPDPVPERASSVVDIGMSNDAHFFDDMYDEEGNFVEPF